MTNNRTVIIIVIVVLLLCCCCPAISYGLYWLWMNGDRLVGNTWQALPLVLMAL